jgi:hypothetical protein
VTTKAKAKNIELIPGFEKPEVGSIVAVEAVDWGQVIEETSGRSEFDIVRGTVYGKVLVCNDDQITLAFQVFHTGNVRGVLSIPWVTVQQVTILDRGTS